MKSIIRFTVFLTLGFCGCERFVEVEVPSNKLVAESVFENNATATGALFNIYATMIIQKANPYAMCLYPGLSADELTPYSSIVGLRQLYSNAIFPLEGYSSDIWTGGYNCIFRANTVLEGCLNSTTLSPEVRKQLIAESKFIRAFWHFYLVNYFGPIPVVTTTDYKINSSLPRSPVTDVYTQIISDLTDAKNDLNENYVDATNIKTTNERVRPNKAAAAALLARVYLFNNNNVDAEREATFVIGKSGTYVLVPLDQVFLKNSQEAIWQIMRPTPVTNNTPEGNGFILTDKPAPNSPVGSNALSKSLVSEFDSADQRRTKWIGKYTDISANPNIDYYFPFKYKVQVGTTVTEYSMILRLAEQFLIRAEARARQDRIPAAIDDLDEVRKRAGLQTIKSIDPNIGKDALLSQIWQERRRELFAEWGHRWLDLRRTQTINTVMAAEAQIKGSTWKPTAAYYPIPETETLKNKNLKQNDGYN